MDLVKMFQGQVLQRIISAVVILLLAFIPMLYGPPLLDILLFVIVGLLSFEWVSLYAKDRVPFTLAIAIPTVLALMSSLYISYDFAPFVFLLALLYVFLILKGSIQQKVWTFFGLLYIGCPLIALIWILTSVPQGLVLLFWIVAIVTSNDAGAYFIGSYIKGPRLWPVISPNKTWSGLVGGLFIGGLVGVLIPLVFSSYFGGTLWQFLLFSMIVSLLSVGGDLLESRIKRIWKVKDSGTLIPGHGGLLDRLDAYLIVLPGIVIFNLLFSKLFPFFSFSFLR
ncbi:MAG: phosphatidate cytidylyltransferase [Alphaproteobacteria bacterium]|jgi:phosphatidate cytidylyltransferase|nr:phosphatidate cytidylyltransferase [Alphaproteobacteria bacterium]MBT5389937.1 phosphatidate cytidylyltransferase [Alphaproteobacteria bacterium]MBT5654449.1 phosphatidate cytidylyltransferase [Alphaproteobacteria bacterium]